MNSPKAILFVLCYCGSTWNLNFDDTFTASQRNFNKANYLGSSLLKIFLSEWNFSIVPSLTYSTHLLKATNCHIASGLKLGGGEGSSPDPLPGPPCPVWPGPLGPHSHFSSHHTLPLSEFQLHRLPQRHHCTLAFTLFLESSFHCPRTLVKKEKNFHGSKPCSPFRFQLKCFSSKPLFLTTCPLPPD